MDALLQYQTACEEMAFPDPNNNTSEGSSAVSPASTESTPSTKSSDKYSLRPRSLRRVTEKQSSPDSYESEGSNHGSGVSRSSNSKSSKPPKPKQKPAPLSKYRRKTANARERSRMREINQAFETLRRAVPHQMSLAQAGNTANEKLTKITTLRLAMKYISVLSATLNSSSSEGGINLDSLFDGSSIDNVNSVFSDYSDLDCFLLESDGESLPLSDHSFLASPDFPESSLSPVDFDVDPALPSLLHTDFGEHALVDPADFGDFLLT